MNNNNSTPAFGQPVVAFLIAVAALLAGCDLVVSSANATAPMAAQAGADVQFFGDQFAAQQKALVADARAPAPTF
jgi:quinolinate synthase